MRDFTPKIYRELLLELKKQEYTFQTFHDFLISPAEKAVVIRHDVDSRKKNSLHFAHIENAFDISTSYYFRMVPKSFDPVIVDLIKDLGHEIGYHYEDLSLAHGDMEKGIQLFEQHLNKMRQYYPVKTICMHGSPLSRYDNRDLWKNYNYRDYDIVGEPYFDIDFRKVFYLTDTGRSWDNRKISIRDYVHNGFNLHFRSTREIIRSCSELPDVVMFNFHPQRWDDRLMPWLRELVFQNMKNLVKKYFFVQRGISE